MLSNSDCPLIRRLYRGFDIRTVFARRGINSNARRRGRIREVVVLDYEPASDSNPLVQLISDERGERKSVMFDGD
jgi:hypothetical protein